MRKFQLDPFDRQDTQFVRLFRHRIGLSVVAAFIGVLILSQVAVAETRVLRSTLSARNGQPFRELMQEAEAAAVQLIERAFAQNSGVTQVSVTVLGERNGQETPLLMTSVSRQNWRKQPQLRPWTTYFDNFSIALLGYRQPIQPQAALPTPVAPPTSQVPTAPTTGIVPAPPVAPTAPAVRPPAPVVAPTAPRSKDELKDNPAYRDD